MAEGFLKSLDSDLEVHSAGTQPAAQTNPHAAAVMREAGIDISANRPKHVDQFLDQRFDYVITVCDDADKSCPRFSGEVGRRLHIGFEDPAKARGNEDEVMAVFRKVRDEIQREFRKFYSMEVERPDD